MSFNVVGIFVVVHFIITPSPPPYENLEKMTTPPCLLDPSAIKHKRVIDRICHSLLWDYLLLSPIGLKSIYCYQMSDLNDHFGSANDALASRMKNITFDY